MSVRRVLPLASIVVLLVAMIAALPLNAVYAQGGKGLYFTSVSSSCHEGIFSFQDEVSPYILVTVEDSQGNALGQESFILPSPGNYDGLITYSQVPAGSVTFKLYAGGRVGSPSAVVAPIGYILFDVVTVPTNCQAGCDTLVPIPSTAVMGRFVADAPLYWAPGKLLSPGLTVTAGKTYLVTGQDASAQYRQILLSCQFVWVPFNSVGPDPEPIWGGKPLPTNVVQ